MIVTTETTQRVVSVTTELAHRPPALENPTSLFLAYNQACPSLDPARDYIISLPPGMPYQRGLSIIGGRNVVMVGGEIRVPAGTTRAVYMKDNRSSVYLEGVKVTGPDTQDAFVIDSRYGADVILQNIAIPDGCHSVDGYHADVIQSWAGPGRLLVDHLYARTFYQGVFVVPDDQWHTAPNVWDGNTSLDLRHVHIDSSGAAGYSLWAAARYTTDGVVPVQCHEVYATPNPARATMDWVCWPKGDPGWAGVVLGSPPVPVVDVNMVGLGYRSVWKELA